MLEGEALASPGITAKGACSSSLKSSLPEAKPEGAWSNVCKRAVGESQFCLRGSHKGVGYSLDYE